MRWPCAHDARDTPALRRAFGLRRTLLDVWLPIARLLNTSSRWERQIPARQLAGVHKAVIVLMFVRLTAFAKTNWPLKEAFRNAADGQSTVVLLDAPSHAYAAPCVPLASIGGRGVKERKKGASSSARPGLPALFCEDTVSIAAKSVRRGFSLTNGPDFAIMRLRVCRTGTRRADVAQW